MSRLLLLMCLILPTWAGAETIDTRLAKYDLCGAYELFHINGVNTEPQEAADNLDRLRTIYGNAYNGHLITYGLGYNASRGVAEDFMDSFSQVVRGYPGATFSKWIRAVGFGIYSSEMTADRAAAIAQALSDVYDINRPTAYTDADLNAIESAIRLRHGIDARMILVPHSQGNLYANLVVDRLAAGGTGRPAISRESIGIAAIATPRAVPGGGYLTSIHDVVINIVRATFSDTPPGNVEIPMTTDDVFGHSLIDIYLRYAPNRVNNLISLGFSGLRSTAASRPFPYWYNTSAGWSNCGPGSPFPWGCFVNGQTWFEPVVQYYSVTPAMQNGTLNAIPGGTQEAADAALALLPTCYAATINEAVRFRLANQSGPFTTFHGCRMGLVEAWELYSADRVESRVRTSLNLPYGGGATATYGPVCLRAT